MAPPLVYVVERLGMDLVRDWGDFVRSKCLGSGAEEVVLIYLHRKKVRSGAKSVVMPRLDLGIHSERP